MPAGDVPDPMPVVPDGDGFAGAIPGDGAPPGWVGAVPVPLGELVVWAWAETARIAAKPAARSVLVTSAWCHRQASWS